MKLILFRHGVAMDREVFAKKNKNDEQRPLIAKGKERTHLMAKALKAWEPKIDMVTSSPLLRAQQTAEIICEHFKKAVIHESKELSPDNPPMAYAQWLKEHAKKAKTIIAVGHEPHLSLFASWCLGGRTQSFIDLKKSGIICLEISDFTKVGPQSAKVLWIVPPKVILNAD